METIKCGKCGKDKECPFYSKRHGGQICESCNLYLNNGELPFDEYSLNPGELTKQMVSDMADVTPRCVEKWKKDGKISAILGTRRILGKLHTDILIFNRDEVKKFLDTRRGDIHLGTMAEEEDHEAAQNGNRLPVRSPRDLTGAAGLALVAQIVTNITNREKNPYLALTGKLFVGITELSDLTKLAITTLNRAIKAAEISGDLKRYRGQDRKRAWKTSDIDIILRYVESVTLKYGENPFAKPSTGNYKSASDGADEVLRS